MNNVLLIQQWVQKSLWLAIIGLIAYNVWVWRQPVLDVDAWMMTLQQNSTSSSATRVFMPNIKPYRLYEKIIVERNPFKTAKMNNKVNKEEVNTGAILDALPNHLSIVGVMQGRVSEVVVEDKRTQETVFLTQGKVEKELKLHHIKNEMIRLQYRGTLYEVPLNP